MLHSLMYKPNQRVRLTKEPIAGLQGKLAIVAIGSFEHDQHIYEVVISPPVPGFPLRIMRREDQLSPCLTPRYHVGQRVRLLEDENEGMSGLSAVITEVDTSEVQKKRGCSVPFLVTSLRRLSGSPLLTAYRRSARTSCSLYRTSERRLFRGGSCAGCTMTAQLSWSGACATGTTSVIKW